MVVALSASQLAVVHSYDNTKTAFLRNFAQQSAGQTIGRKAMLPWGDDVESLSHARERFLDLFLFADFAQITNDRPGLAKRLQVLAASWRRPSS